MGNMIELIPLVGINFGEKQVAFMDSREEVENVLGMPYENRGNSFVKTFHSKENLVT